MAVEIGALRALLSLDSAAFERGAKRARASMNKLQRSLTDAGDRMQRVGKRLTAGLTLPLAGLATVAVRSSLSVVDAQAKMAQSMDTTTASLQVLSRAAQTAGISQSDLEGSLRRMTRRVSLAEKGTGAAVGALKQLNLTAKELAPLDAAERVALIRERLEEFVPTAQRAGVASEIFGDRTGIAMLRLNPETIAAASAELDRFGVTVTEIEADQIEAANDAMSALGLASRGLANQLTVALAPVLQDIAEFLGNVAAAFANLSPQMQRIIVIVGSFAAAIGPVILALGLATKAVAGLTISLAGLKTALVTTGIGALVVGAGFLLDKLFQLREATGSWGAALEVLGDVAAGVWEGISTSAQAIVPALNAVWMRIQSGFFSLLSRLTEAWSRFLGGLGQDIADVPGLGKFSDRLLESSGQAVTALSEFDAKANSAASSAARLQGEASNLAVAGFDRARAAAERLQAILETETEVSDDATRSARDLAASLDDIGGGEGGGSGGRAANAIEDVSDATEDLGRSSQGISRMFATTFSSIIRGAETAGQALSRLLDRLADMLLTNAFESLFKSISFGGGGGGGKGLLGMGNFLGFLDGGGSIGRGQFAVVGERRPEIVTGPANVIGGRQTSEIMQRGGSDTVVNVNIATEPGLKAEVKESNRPGVRDIEVQIQRVVESDVQNGGRIHRSIRRTFGVKPQAG